jgi:hypothetical protein
LCARNQKAVRALETPLSTTPLVTANGTIHHLAVSKSRDVSKAGRVVSAGDEEGNPWPYMTDFYKFLTRNAVFRIRDFLIWIRSSVPVPLDYWSGSGSFPQCLSRFRRKLNLFIAFYLPFHRYVPVVCPFSSVFKDNKLLRSRKIVEIKVFLRFLAC